MELEPESSPRISFSTDLLEDDDDFICITPISPTTAFLEYKTEKSIPQYTDFEFLLDTLTSQNTTTTNTTTTADQLFFDGKLLPFSNQTLTHIRLKEEKKNTTAKEEEMENKQNRIGWTCVDEDPSPKPPTCTLLWKELLRLKKQQRSSSSSSSLSPSPSSCSSIVGDLPMIEEGKEEGQPGSLDKHIKWLKKGLEKTRRSTSTTRIRPMSSNVSTPSISSPPLFPLLLKKVRVLER